MGDVLCWNAGAGIRNLHRYSFLFKRGYNADRAVLQRVSEGVVDEIFEHPLCETYIGEHVGKIFSDAHPEIDLFILCSELELLQDVPDKFSQGERLKAHPHIG